MKPMVFMRLRNVAFGFQERTQSPQRRPRRGPRGVGDVPGGAGSGPGAAQGTRRRPGRPRKAPRMPPSLKSDGLAEVFKRNVKPNQGFRGVDAPKARNLPGFLTAQASLSSLPGVLVEARARPASQTKTLIEITGRKVFRDSCGTDVHWPVSTKLSD